MSERRRKLRARERAVRKWANQAEHNDHDGEPEVWHKLVFEWMQLNATVDRLDPEEATRRIHDLFLRINSKLRQLDPLGCVKLSVAKSPGGGDAAS